jgi:hypothetical protein
VQPPPRQLEAAQFSSCSSFASGLHSEPATTTIALAQLHQLEADWSEAGRTGVMALKTIQDKLNVWGSKEFGCLARKVRKLRERLDNLRRNSVGHVLNDEERSIVMQLRDLLLHCFGKAFLGLAYCDHVLMLVQDSLATFIFPSASPSPPFLSCPHTMGGTPGALQGVWLRRCRS